MLDAHVGQAPLQLQCVTFCHQVKIVKSFLTSLTSAKAQSMLDAHILSRQCDYAGYRCLKLRIEVVKLESSPK